MKKALTQFAILVYLLVPVAKYVTDDRLHIWVLDVDQGDAVLIRTPDKKHILIDTGPDNFVLAELGEVLPYWVRKIDYLVISHPHYDHLGAAVELLERFDIGQIVWYRVEYFSPIYEWLEEVFEVDPDRFITFIQGEEINIGEVVLKFAFPLDEEGDEIPRYPNVNNASVSFLLIYRDFEAWFSGDAEEEQEREMVEHLGELVAGRNVEMMKGGHHCSNTSNSEGLLEVLRPTLVVCSVGKDNSHGHPHGETLKKLDENGIEIFRTDEDGRLEIISNGDWYRAEIAEGR